LIGPVYQAGLADADDEDDFAAKLSSFESIWEDIAPTFHQWFNKNHAPLFIECLIQTVREELGIYKRFYNNNLELNHKLQKKKFKEINNSKTKVDVFAASDVLQTWVDENFFTEISLALRGFGKYKLAHGYEQFFVQSQTWTRWSPDRRNQHIQAFLKFSPKPSQLYHKPASAGLKRPGQKRRSSEEATIFIECPTSSPSSSAAPSSSKPLSSASPSLSATSLSATQLDSQEEGDELLGFDPDRATSNSYEIVVRGGNCPKSVKRCESCKFPFNKFDKVLVKTVGVREFTDKNGHKKSATGNVYFHYLSKCLREHDHNFSFSKITVPAETQNLLTVNMVAMLKAKGCTIG